MVTLDIRTLAFVLAAIIITQSLALLVMRQTHKTFGGFGFWTLASAALAVSFLLLGLRSRIPDFFSIVVANLLQIVAGILVFMGIRKFFGKPYQDALNYLLAASVMAALVWFLYADNDEIARVLVVSGAWFIWCLRCALVLVADAPEELRPSARFTGAMMGALGLVQLFRGVYAWDNPAEGDLFSPSTVQALIFLSWIGLAVGLTFGLFMMTSRRLELELAERVLQAYTDELTGAWNRRYLIESSQREVNRARRYGHVLSMLAIDIDLFKQINDTYGHTVGDLFLKRLTAAARLSLRDSDIFARTGGEEFAVLLPQSDAAKSMVVAERIRSGISKMTIHWKGVPVRITVSIGVASLDPSDQEIHTVFQRADAALYEAKRKGRNRVVTK